MGCDDRWYDNIPEKFYECKKHKKTFYPSSDDLFVIGDHNRYGDNETAYCPLCIKDLLAQFKIYPLKKK